MQHTEVIYGGLKSACGLSENLRDRGDEDTTLLMASFNCGDRLGSGESIGKCRARKSGNSREDGEAHDVRRKIRLLGDYRS